VTDADDDSSAGVSASATLGPLRISGAFIDRTKQIPTASFLTIFGAPRAQTEDRRGYVDASYTGPFTGAWTGVARAGIDFNSYAGAYAYSEADASVLQIDGADSVQMSGELTLNRRARQHMFTLGGDVRGSLHNHQFASDDYGDLLDESHPSSVLGLYAQDEITIQPWLLLNAGVRLGYDSGFGANVAPRAGLVFLPRPGSSLKLLHGRAFRAPNSYERYYYSTMEDYGFTLKPETIMTTELVWESTMGSHLRTAMSAFHYDVDQLIEQRTIAASEATDGGLYFVNAGRTTANGADAELEAFWASGIAASVGYAYVHAKDPSTGGSLSNSPRHMTNARFLAPLGSVGSTLALEARGVSERLSIDGGTVPGFVTGNVTVTRAMTTRLDLGVSVHNIFNTGYADPGAEEHVQRAIPQDGRTFRVRARVRF